MKNEQPIFLNCFSRGGSNILWNFFLTHPDVCSPIQETIQIFRLDLKGITFPGLHVALTARQPRLFDQWLLKSRREIPRTTQKFIDQTLYRWKLKTLDDAEMRFKSEDTPYTLQEVQLARLVAKNNNGLVFLSDILSEMYPGAIFFALVREPYALYESHKRRGITKSVEEFVDFYTSIANRMLADKVRIRNYHIVKFEELLAEPLAMIKYIYDCAGLEFTKIDKIRLKAKPHLHANGSHKTPFKQGQHYWFAQNDLYQMLEPGINELQGERLDEQERRVLNHRLAPICQRLGYP